MNRNNDLRIKVEPMILSHNSTTAPVFGTTQAAASKGIDIRNAFEVDVVAAVGIYTTTTGTLTIKIQEAASNSTTDADWSDLFQDDKTTACRFFESQSTAGTLPLTAANVNTSYYGTIKADQTKGFIRAVPVNGTAAGPTSVFAILHEFRDDVKSSQVSQFRVSNRDDGIAV